MDSHQGVEREFDLVGDQPLPDLVGGPVASIGPAVVSRLEATYLDTDSLALTRARITLRRRTGGDDAGWHLKLPAAGHTRTELRRPLGRGIRTVPPELLDQVRAVVRDHRVEPVAVLRTTRTERHLYGADGTELAVLADDTVEAERLVGTPGRLAWRELEVELVHGDDAVLQSVAEILAAGGVPPSAAASKLAKVLDGGAAGSRPVGSRGAPLAVGSVGELVQRHVAAQVTDLLQQDRAARSGDEDAVHDLRVAARRIRSLLATYRSVLDRAVTDPVRDELRWLGAEVGAARDAQVQRARLLARLDAVPRDLVLGPVRRRAGLELRASERAGLDRLRTALSSTRYYRLLDDLDELAAGLPLTAAATRPAGATAPALVGHQVRRVRRASAAAEAAGEDDREAALHVVRKAAKRARYAAESLIPVVGKDAGRLASRMEALQDLLGEHQDAVTARTLHRALGGAAHAAGENGFTFGMLRAEEDAAARAARTRYPDTLRRATASKVTRWTR
jgi:CHAD domain-containing protein